MSRISLAANGRNAVIQLSGDSIVVTLHDMIAEQ